jgi:hypothetical protein
MHRVTIYRETEYAASGQVSRRIERRLRRQTMWCRQWASRETPAAARPEPDRHVPPRAVDEATLLWSVPRRKRHPSGLERRESAAARPAPASPTSSHPPRYQLSASRRISPACDLILTPRGVNRSLAAPASLIAAPFDRLLADDQGHRQATSECRNGVKHK